MRIAPDYAQAREGLGRICEGAGQLDKACTHYSRALADNPFYRTVATRLALIALESGATAEAQRTLEENLAACTDAWLDWFLLGKVHLAVE